MDKRPTKRKKRVCVPRPWETLARINRIRAMQLRAKQLTFRQIGAQLGRSHTTARRYILSALNPSQPST